MTPVPHFFVSPSAIVADTVTLQPDAAHHAATVLRLGVHDSLVVLNNTGTAYRARITVATPKSVTATIESAFAPDTEPRTRITVAQVLPKTGEKIEQVLQHGTEIGADGFVVFQSERSVARMETRDRVEKKTERWRGIVQSAAE
ncbi:MAG: 16S rRNA (uracil(1498)-N(3))-methyltransferase, partial [Armatimonadetes bacterium]|nr:16S rRNA (uracil(1498)-N(3))-methyltransferase [Armatimonadota bacterium]